MIPDRFIVTGIVVRVVFLFFAGERARKTSWMRCSAASPLAAVYCLSCSYTKKVRQKEAMGGGDDKLLFLTGLFLGWQRNILCLLIACVLGIVFAFIFPEKRTTEDGAEGRRRKAFSVGAVHLGGSDSHAPLRQRDHRRVFELILTERTKALQLGG